MAKTTPAVPALQPAENPTVLIRYEPANAPIVLAQNTMHAINKLSLLRPIRNAKDLEAFSVQLDDANLTLGEVDTFLDSLRGAIQKACERVREIRGFEDFEATLTVRKWKLRTLLERGIQSARHMRADFLAAEQEKQRKLQQEAEAKQAEINKKTAENAAKTAKAQGASAETVREIKQEVLSTPAPIVESKTLATAAAAGTSVRYDYSADLKDPRQFFVYCLNTPSMFATLAQVAPEVEKVFRSMARSQKEQFNYPGMTFKKTPVDTQRGR